jgi:hypothetical protein
MTDRLAPRPVAGRGEELGSVPLMGRGEEIETVPGVAPAEALSSGISWPAVLAGAVVAAALWFSLMTLGAGMGLSAVSPWPTGASARQLGGGAILWIMIVQLVSCSLGGYLAGRLRSRWARVHVHELHFRDTAHGFLVWAVGLVISVAFLSAIGVSIAKEAAPAAAEGANDYYADSLFRTDHPVAASDDQAVRKEASAILAVALSQPEISGPDRGYLASMVSARTGLDRAQAEARVNDTVAAARQAADATRKALAHSLYWLFAALLLGAFCGSVAATIGGRQRDRVVIVGLKPAEGI